MPLWWEQNIASELLSDDALLQMLPYMCKIEAEDRRNADRHDAITSTAITFLSCPLHLTLTEVGASVFQGRATLVYPYNLMSDRQRSFVRECLSRRGEWNLFNEAVVFRKSRGGPPLALPPLSVLSTLCAKVLESGAHPDPRGRVALCNIILQRIQGYVPIDKPVQRQLNEWLAKRADPAEGIKPPAAGGGSSADHEGDHRQQQHEKASAGSPAAVATQ